MAEGHVSQEAKEEMMSVKDMWSGCHRGGKDGEEGQIEVLWGLSLYNLENHLSKRIQNCRYKIRYRHWKEPVLVTGRET